MKPSEIGAMVSALGGVISLLVTFVQPLTDWRGGQLKDWGHYIGMMFFLAGPFIVAFVIFAYYVRKSRSP